MRLSSKFTIQEVSGEVAGRFWLSSPQAVLFNKPDVVSTISDDHSWWLVSKGEEPFLLWPVHLGDDKLPAVPPFAYFFGPMWSPVSESRAVSSIFADRLAAYNEMISFLIYRFGGVANSFHPSLTDIRAFSWWGHHTGQDFAVYPRYTAQITNLQTKSQAQVLGSFRELRRRENKRVELGCEYTLVTDVNQDRIKSLYYATFAKQGQTPSETDVGSITNLLSLVKKGYGFMMGAKSASSKEIEGVTLILVSGETANMALNLTSPAKRASGVGAWLIQKAIDRSQVLGVNTFDFNGANSPRRADDKHSYGAREVLYFEIRYPS